MLPRGTNTSELRSLLVSKAITTSSIVMESQHTGDVFSAKAGTGGGE